MIVLRRLWPALLLVGAWGLISLQRIFIQESDAERAQLKARRTMLQTYAKNLLSQRLIALTESARPRIEAALKDPLVSDRGVVLFDRGEQRLPRMRAHRPQSEAQAVYRGLRDKRLSPESGSPWADRVALFYAFEQALEASQPTRIEEGLRALLAHRARFVLRSDRDLALMILAMERFTETAQPASGLLRKLLRDGLPFKTGSAQERMEGLQRALLARSDKLSLEDFRFLAGRIRSLSQAGFVPFEDFVARVQASSISIAEPGPSDALLKEGWFIRGEEQGRRVGVRVPLQSLVEEIGAEMRAGGLLRADERFDVPGPTELGALRLHLNAPSEPVHKASIASRYRIKTLLGVVCFALALGVAALVILMQRRKQRYLELKSDFVATVSHELRTPLASIRLLAETLERRVAQVPKAKDYPARIVREIDSLSFLVENILSFNRLDKGRLRPRLGKVNLGSLLSSIEEELGPQLPRPLRVQHALQERELQADPELVKLLFVNLIKNAALYNESDVATVDVSLQSAANAVQISVQDNGVGVPQDRFTEIFGDFYRAPETASLRTKGSGLGLAICERIMRAHGGGIRVASAGPDGTTFELRWPYEHGESSDR